MHIVKTGYHVIREKELVPSAGPSSSGSIPQSVWKLIWSLKVPQKMKQFLWKACNNILPNKKRIAHSAGVLFAIKRMNQWNTHFYFVIGLGPYGLGINFNRWLIEVLLPIWATG